MVRAFSSHCKVTFDSQWCALSFSKALYFTLHQSTQPAKLSRTCKDQPHHILHHTDFSRKLQWESVFLWSTQPLVLQFHKQAVQLVQSTGTFGLIADRVPVSFLGAYNTPSNGSNEPKDKNKLKSQTFPIKMVLDVHIVSVAGMITTSVIRMD